jgi:hypothetical protein
MGYNIRYDESFQPFHLFLSFFLILVESSSTFLILLKSYSTFQIFKFPFHNITLPPPSFDFALIIYKLN